MKKVFLMVLFIFTPALLFATQGFDLPLKKMIKHSHDIFLGKVLKNEIISKKVEYEALYSVDEKGNRTLITPAGSYISTEREITFKIQKVLKTFDIKEGQQIKILQTTMFDDHSYMKPWNLDVGKSYLLFYPQASKETGYRFPLGIHKGHFEVFQDDRADNLLVVYANYEDDKFWNGLYQEFKKEQISKALKNFCKSLNCVNNCLMHESKGTTFRKVPLNLMMVITKKYVDNALVELYGKYLMLDNGKELQMILNQIPPHLRKKWKKDRQSIKQAKEKRKKSQNK